MDKGGTPTILHFILMTRKLIAKIPCKILSKESTAALKLEEQPYLPFIPKSLLQKIGITKDEFSVDLVVEGKKMSLEASI